VLGSSPTQAAARNALAAIIATSPPMDQPTSTGRGSPRRGDDIGGVVGHTRLAQVVAGARAMTPQVWREHREAATLELIPPERPHRRRVRGTVHEHDGRA